MYSWSLHICSLFKPYECPAAFPTMQQSQSFRLCGPKCFIQPQVGRCTTPAGRFYFDTITGKCTLFVYSGCGGNENNFLTSEECLQECKPTGVYPRKCKWTPGKGKCNSPSIRYFFSPAHAICIMFTYTGCGGNDNNFLTLHECIKQCKRFGDPQKECFHPVEVGRCKASFHRFYFNTRTKNCEEFIYGGCGGNENNFVNWITCRAMCQNS
ncbi:boophilin-G2-like, partial [Protobothrops mucrosquamatus]|uniref:boophilin-G2-like n=1 Tax=Protobothrops mucrosquamatus TaxID=103944 RepID=UPI0010FB0C64